ncbi:MAG: tubulin-like doman-containing protein, partial [Defluviitaleaceae bacterium]|nr:tubulin-like doman-containing protein [Defluviitaleaceae bacterium]
MKQIILENIKQMDISTGGGIFGEKARIDTINHPVLVIGLGGTGIDALLRLKYQISRRFKLPEKKQKPDNIEYLALETNAHDRKNYRGVTLDAYTEAVLLSNAGIGAILNNRSTIPDYISEWLSPDLTITDGTKGASGNRQAGRLLLFEKINTAIDAISNKIKSLRSDRENKLLVFVLSGVSGGTGGGMFMDVPYIVRGLMEREYGAKGIDKVEITGYLFTPDVHLAGNNISIHTEEYIQRNGYAALKELDYFMNIEERGERFSQRYGTRLEVHSALPPFNLCHLVSACNIDGVFLKNAYDYCMNVTAENIVNFLALEDKESGSEFAVQDYHSNLISNIAAMKSNLPPGMAACANFSYNIIGASAAVLPMEGFNAYLAHALFCEMGEMFEAEPDDYDLQEFAKPLEISALGAQLARTLPPIKLDYAETDYYSHRNVIKTRRVDVDEKLAEQFASAKRELSNGKQFIAAIVERVKADLREIFTNPDRGAFYTTRIIHSDVNPCLLARIGAYQAHLREKIDASAGEIDANEVVAEMRFEEAAKAIFSRE